MIEIVIKIEEETYNRIMNGWMPLHKAVNLMENVQKGTPLPKGHGRLKDVDAFLSKVKADREHSAYSRSWTADDVLNALNNNYATTIVEAESEE